MTSYQLYRHYENQKLYRIINEFTLEATGENWVTYQCVNGQGAEMHGQPKDKFFETFNNGKKRFSPFKSTETNGPLYNCVHDRLIEEFDENYPQPSEITFSFHNLNLTLFYLIYSLKDILGTETTVQEDLRERKQKGLETYGVYLTPFNGRNALQDAYEEYLDLLCYLFQYKLEQEQSVDRSPLTDNVISESVGG